MTILDLAPIAPHTAAPQHIAGDTYLIPSLLPAEPGTFVYLNSMVILGDQPVIVDTGAPLFRDQWLEVPANADLDNGFKLQWEEYLRDVLAGRPHRFGLLSAARGVQLAELGLQSSAEGRRMSVPEIVL